MQIKSMRWPRFRDLERGAAELSREALKRLQWFDFYQSQGRKAAVTCRYFGISCQTFYRWKARYDPQDLSTLEDRSHRPQRRKPNESAASGNNTRAGARTSWPWCCGARAGRCRSRGWGGSSPLCDSAER